MRDGADHTDVVARSKAWLEAFNVDLSGPCGALQIVNAAAWELRADGAGLLEKTTGNNCNGRAADIIAYPDGTIVDALIDGGGANTPAWQVQPGQVDPTRWRPPTDPTLGGIVSPPPLTSLPDPGVDLAERLAHIDGLLVGIAMQIDDSRRAIQQQIDQAIKNAERSAAPLLAMLKFWQR